MKRILLLLVLCLGLVGCSGKKYDNMDNSEKLSFLQGTYEYVMGDDDRQFVISNDKLTHINKVSDYEIEYSEKSIELTEDGFTATLSSTGIEYGKYKVLQSDENMYLDFIDGDKKSMHRKVSSSTDLPEAKEVGGDPEIGMTKEDVELSSWGKPDDINKTTTKHGIREQWVYSNNRYIYFEDEIVTTIQE